MTLGTVNDDVTVKLVKTEHDERIPVVAYWTDAREKKEAMFPKRDGSYFLHVTMEKEADLASGGSSSGSSSQSRRGQGHRF